MCNVSMLRHVPRMSTEGGQCIEMGRGGRGKGGDCFDNHYCAMYIKQFRMIYYNITVSWWVFKPTSVLSTY